MESDLIWKVYENIPHNDKLIDNINSLIKIGYILVHKNKIEDLEKELEYYK